MSRWHCDVLILFFRIQDNSPHGQMPELFRKVKEIGDKQKLQDDIDKLVKWSEK